MNSKSMLTLLVPFAIAAGLGEMRAQSWDTILPNSDFTSSFSGSAVLIDPFQSTSSGSPALFLAAYADSTSLGSIYHLAPDALNPAGYMTIPVDNDLPDVFNLGYNPVNSTIYAIGDRLRVAAAPFPRDNNLVWKVRKSTAAGAVNTWTEDDSFYITTKGYARARGIATDVTGNIYVAGEAVGTAGSSHWIVRKLPLGGQWTTICDVSGQGNALATDVAAYPGIPGFPAAVFTVGFLNSKWAVMRSLDQGASWQIVDSWSANSKTAATAWNISYIANGTIFVVGSRGDPNYPTGWVVRTSKGGSSGTWTTQLDASEGAYSRANRVTTDLTGNVWISGFTENAAGTPRWTVLEYAGDWAAAWNSRQRPFGETYSIGRGLTASRNSTGGYVFVAGQLSPNPNQNQVGLLGQILP